MVNPNKRVKRPNGLGNVYNYKTDEEFNYSTLKKSVAELKSKIKNLGDVNVNAIEDYKNLVERYDLLKTQHDDLVESEKALLDIIEELDVEMRKQFEEKFAYIKSQFDAFSRPEHFERYLPEYPNLDELKAHYTRGGLGDMKVKKFLAAIMQEELGPIRDRRKEFEKDIPAVYEMLRKGCEVARETASATLDEVRRAMKINYFDDADLIAEQVKRFAGE